MRKVWVVFFILFSFSGPAQALLMDARQVLEITLSSQGMTRISVENAKIQDVFLHPAGLSENIQLHKSGHVFLTPEGMPGPVFLTLITDQDQTQDLKIRFQKGVKNLPVILSPRDPKDIPKTPESQRQAIHLLLKEFLEGRIPEGFIPLKARGDFRSGSGVDFKEIKRFQKGALEILVFKGKNTREGLVILEERTFSRPQDKGLLFEHRTLRSGEETTLWVVKEEK